MPSIALKRFLATVSFAFASSVALAKDAPPRIVQEPVFGLRLASAGIRLDALPEDVRSKCSELADDDKWAGRLWVYARADDAGATYYVVGGYFERRNPAPGEARFELDERGGVISIDGAECTAYGPARKVFDVRAFNEIPQSILQRLAADLGVRLARAFGGPDRLRAELRNQRIDPDPLPAELRQAFKSYFER
jgi:hypothetical protein